MDLSALVPASGREFGMWYSRTRELYHYAVAGESRFSHHMLQGILYSFLVAFPPTEV